MSIKTKSPYQSFQSQISEAEMQDILYRASKAYSSYNSSISFDELMNAGKGAEIPAEFLIEAYQNVLVKRRDKNRFWQVIKAGVLIGTGIVCARLWRLTPETTTTPTPEPVPVPVTSHTYYVYSIDDDWGDYDGNAIATVTVFENGNSGHVTEIKCILPPNISTSSIKRITRGKDSDTGYGHFCYPVSH